MKRINATVFTTLLFLVAGDAMAANYPPNIDYGQQGDFIAKRGVERGRTAILAPIGPILLNLPESPGSSDDNVQLRNVDTAWNLEDLTNPQLIGEFNCDPAGQNCRNGQGIHAHAVYTRFVNGQAYLRGNFRWQEGGFAYYDPSQPTLLQQVQRTGSTGSVVGQSFGYAGLTSKYAAKDYWEYNTDVLDDPQLLTEPGSQMPQADIDKLQAQGLTDEFPSWWGPHVSDVWNHTGLTGVTGFPIFSGNLLVIASDQQNTGMAVYDIANIDRNTAPSLLAVFDPQLTEPGGQTVGIGGYWVEPYGANKVVFSARANSRRDHSAFYVVDFEDPQNPRLTCEVYFDQDRTIRTDGDFHSNAQYVNFQDQYAYVDHFRVDIELCEQIYAQAKANDPAHILSSSEIAPFVYKFPDTEHFCDSSQYFRPLGQVGVFGGYNLGPEFFVTLDQVVPATDIGYYRWYVSQRSGAGASLSSAHTGNVYGVDRDADWQVGDVINGPGGSRYTVTQVDRNTVNTNFQGMCFFVTSDQPDVRAPYVAGHRPLAGQVNVPVTTMIHLHVPETLRSETVANAISLTRLDTDQAVAFEHQLSHTGTITIFPVSDLTVDVSYRVDVAGIRDFMGNTMTPYSFTFSTGESTPPPPPPPPSDDPPPTYTGTPYYPNQSSQLACSLEGEVNNLWAVNPDNDSVSIIDTNLSSEFELSYVIANTIQSSYQHPTSVTRVGSRYAVTYRDSDRVVFYNASGTVSHDLFTGYGTQPISSVTDGTFLYVALYRAGVQRSGGDGELVLSDYGEILKIRLSDHQIVNRRPVGPTPKAMALRNERLLITRFISPSTHAEVYDVNTSDLTLTRTITINKVTVPDDLDHGSGVPNFLNSIVFSPDGSYAYVAAVKQNVDTNTMDDDNTVRPMAAIIDLVQNRDANVNPSTPDGTWDFDNAADPQYVSYLVNGDPLFAFQGNNNVRVFDIAENEQGIFNTGFAPQATCSTLRTLYVKNFTDRSVSAIDVAGWIHNGAINPTVTPIELVAPGNDVLSADELAGLQAFYHSDIPVFGPEGYMSCASCHMGGGHDGQVWNMTPFGEGLRNTLSLNGQSGTRFGNLHWTSNFDEVQDFIFQIINLNRGTADVTDFNAARDPLQVNTTGLSQTIDSLAAYVASLGRDTLQRSAVKGSEAAAARRGEQIFYDRNCASCHAPPAFTDGQRHDVGTGLPIRTPRLTDLPDSSPYLHDGRAATLSSVFNVGTTHVQHVQGLTATERGELMSYLLSLDDGNFIADNDAFTGQASWIGQFGPLVELPEEEGEWVYCSAEGGSCVLPENATLRYGANGVYHYRHGVTGNTQCSNQSLGDPLTGVVKECFYYVPAREDGFGLCFPIKSVDSRWVMICL